MTVIQKRADELKPGDVIQGNGTYGKRIVVDAFGATAPDTRIVVDAFSQGQRNVDRYWIDADIMLDVEAPDLTLAQQHAEEMAELLTDILGRAVDPQQIIPQRINVLLDKIKPPEPPTLAETLAELDSLRGHAKTCGAFEKCGVVMERSVDALLDRARRAKLI